MTKPRFSACGAGALLMDVSEGSFDLRTQQHLWFLTAKGGPVERLRGVRNAVLGINNVLFAFDPLIADLPELQNSLEDAWSRSAPHEGTGRVLEVPVAYDTSPGSELEGIARHVRLSIDEVIRLHTSEEYHVACIGSVPGFAYLVGLPPRLAVPRRQTPRARVPKGSVAIGGAQTGVIPTDMPSGWHMLGMTELDMFDSLRAEPCLLAPGDRIRFSARGAAS
ncbi:5-oxoprolinase subunit PxpB [Ramlibacter sp. WS9]|nr:5-oxoprolinase subunit PxpB [Ramlibacter sp. WS9]